MSRFRQRLPQIFVFLLIFALDVRSRARAIDAPAGCTKTGGVCAVLSDSGLLRKAMPWGELRAGEGSSYIVVSDSEIRLIRGHFLIDSKSSEKNPTKITAAKVSTLYGDFKVRAGQTFFDVKDAIVSFTNISSELTYEPLGETQFYDLPRGFMNYLTKVTSKGVAEAGYPRLAELKPLIKGWGSLFASTEIGKFRTDFDAFSVHWSKAQKIVGPWYTETVEREIASERAEEERAARLREIQRQENAKWKKMFRERNYLGVDPGDTHD